MTTTTPTLQDTLAALTTARADGATSDQLETIALRYTHAGGATVADDAAWRKSIGVRTALLARRGWTLRDGWQGPTPTPAPATPATPAKLTPAASDLLSAVRNPDAQVWGPCIDHRGVRVKGADGAVRWARPATLQQLRDAGLVTATAFGAHWCDRHRDAGSTTQVRPTAYAMTDDQADALVGQLVKGGAFKFIPRSATWAAGMVGCTVAQATAALRRRCTYILGKGTQQLDGTWGGPAACLTQHAGGDLDGCFRSHGWAMGAPF
jgi:hypothetical protein